MISLYDYILESLQINEAYKIIAVTDEEFNDKLNNLLSKLSNIDGELTNELITIFNELVNNSNYNNIKFSNTVKNKVKVHPDVKELLDGKLDTLKKNLSNNITISESKNGWIIKNNKTTLLEIIYGKGSTNYTNDGDTFGQLNESVITYLFNKYSDKLCNYNKDELKTEITKIKSTDAIDEDTINNYANEYSDSVFYFFKTLFNDNFDKKHNEYKYIAVHVGGNDLVKPEGIYTDIAKIYNGQIQEIIKQHCPNVKIEFPGLPTGPKTKDTWNKADILLISTTYSVDKNINKSILDVILDAIQPINADIDTEKVNATEILNNTLNSFVVKNIIIPISVKKMTKEGQCKIINMPSKGTIINVTDTKLVLPSKKIAFDNNDYSGSVYLHCTNNYNSNNIIYSVQFRSQSKYTNNLSIETGLPDNENARGGKGVTLVKNALKINKLDKSYYNNILHFSGKKLEDLTFDDIYKCLSLITSKIIYNNVEIKSGKDLYENWAQLVCGKNITAQELLKKPCFCGLIGLYLKHTNNKEIYDSENQYAFATLVLSKCVEGVGTSTYYSIY